MLERVQDLPYDLRERIASIAIATRMHDVLRTAVYNATVLRYARFQRGRRCERQPHKHMRITALVPFSATGLDSHGLGWSNFPKTVTLVPLGADRAALRSSSYSFDVNGAGLLRPCVRAVKVAVRDAHGVRICGVEKVTAYAQAKYERLLRAVLHYHATEIQRVLRGAITRRWNRQTAVQ